MSTVSTDRVQIDVVSDVMCPWCYVGKRRLEKALELVNGVEVEVHWRPFQLDPTLPPEGRDRREYLEKKFGGKQGPKKFMPPSKTPGEMRDWTLILRPSKSHPTL